jgi:hypothetical protein
MTTAFGRSIDTRPLFTTGLTPSLTEGHSGDEVQHGIEVAARAADFREFMDSLPVSMSPAMIFMMLQKRMQSLDSQIQSRIGGMEDQQAELASLNENAGIIQALQAASTRDGNIDADTIVTIDGESHSARDWLEIAGVEVATVPDAETGDWYTAAGMRAAVESIQSTIKEVNQGAEMTMMELQSLMQQRSSEISLATNMLKSVQDGTDAIVRNIG